MTRAAALLVVVAAAAGTARADLRDTQGGAVLRYEAGDVHALDDHSEPRDLALAGAHLDGVLLFGRHVGYHAQLDLAAGTTLGRAGFAYDVSLLPVGVALRFGDTQLVGVAGGVGAMGAVGSIDDAATFPIEAFADLALGAHLRVMARARATYLAGATVREDHQPELDAQLAVRLGHRYREWGFPSGNGYFVGGEYRELAGERFAGVIFGYAIDLATAPQR
jgi:hypothetical protein|nr:hypothetical protein [Kofleriaceae bacterium]